MERSKEDVCVSCKYFIIYDAEDEKSYGPDWIRCKELYAEPENGFNKYTFYCYAFEPVYSGGDDE